MDTNARKYIDRYAEAEARLRLVLPRRYESVLVVPACDEASTFVGDLSAAFPTAGGLLILVVNSTCAASKSIYEANLALMDDLLASSAQPRQLNDGPPIYLLPLKGCDLLLVDRTTAGHQLAQDQGVGLARRIGADIALNLKLSGIIAARGFGCTDADVHLPPRYFDVGERAVADASAAVFPFAHQASADADLSSATAAYELSLRYLLLGLHWAGSSYAYHSLGSALYLGFSAYAKVRGFPKRQAGEDFYILDKLAKLGSLRRLQAPTLQIAARASTRVPFGTGPRVQKLMQQSLHGQTLRLYHPQSFHALGEVLAGFQRFATTRDIAELHRRLQARRAGPQVVSHLTRIGFEQALESAAMQAKNEVQLLRRLLTWFDALKTLKLLHALRDSCHPELEWQHAIETADFVPSQARAALRRTDASGYFEVLQVLREREKTLPELVGVACPAL